MKRAWMWMLIGVLTLGVSAATTLRADTAANDKDAGPKWTEDYKAAVAQAKKENKMIFLDFTGSDWCIWCKRLHQDVFSTPAFSAWAKAKFILVEVDFPQTKKQSDAIKAQNQGLQKKYSIEGYPTIIILDAQEKKLAQAGYDNKKGKDWDDARDAEIAKAQGK